MANSQLKAAPQIAKQQEQRTTVNLIPALAFVITLGFCWLTNSVDRRLHFEQLYDSGHYIETCRLTLLYFQQLLGQHGQNLDYGKLANYLMLDGPVLPVAVGLVLAVLNISPSQDTSCFLVFQCFLQASSACLVTLLAQNLFSSRKWAFAAGIIWGVYPPALLATTCLMSETITSLILLLQVYMLTVVINKKGVMPPFVVGILSCFTLLTKPALLTASACMNCLSLFYIEQKRLLTILAILIGFGLTMVPWLMFTKANFGQAYFAPQRQPAFNMAKGCDIESDGLGGFPNTALTSMYGENDGALAVFSAVASKQPLELISLTLRKIPRLFSLPWNDYRLKLFGISMQVQVLAHRLIWLAAIAGALTVLLALRQKDLQASRLFVGEASIAVILCHLSYVFFEAIPRYGFTAMPFVVLLAVYFVHSLVACKSTWRDLLLFCVSLAMVLVSLETDLAAYLFILTNDTGNALWLGVIGQWFIVGWTFFLFWKISKKALPEAMKKSQVTMLVFVGIVAVLLANHKFTNNLNEWQCVLKPGMAARRTITLADGVAQKPSWALALIDADSNLSSASIMVNGHLLTEKPVSIYQFHPIKYQLLNVMQLQSAIFGQAPEAMRQWRAVPVPIEWLDLNGKNTITVQASESKVVIYGDYPAAKNAKRVLPSFEVFSHGRLWNSPTSLDGRLSYSYGIKDSSSVSCLLSEGQEMPGDLSKTFGRQVGQYRICLVIGKQRGFQMPLTKASPKNVQVSELGEISIAGADAKDLTLDIPSRLANENHLQISLQTDCRSNARAAATFVLMAESADEKAYVVLPDMPKTVFVGNNWQHLSFEETIPTRAVPGGPQKLRLQIYPPANFATQNGGIYLRNLKVKIAACDRPTLAGHWLAIY